MVAWGELDVEVALQSSTVSVLVGPPRITDCKKRKETWRVEYAKLNVCSYDFPVCLSN